MAARISSYPILVRRALPGAYFICRHQGGSHAEWPKDSHAHAPTQTCGIICCPPKAVDTKCRSNPVERASKRPKKLRAISGASPGGSPVGECCRRGELLPARRTLLQIDVPGPRRNTVDAVSPSRLELSCELPVGAVVPKLAQAQLESIFLWAAACDRLTIREPHRDYYGTLLTVLKINRVRGDGHSCGGFRSLKALSS
jgi:hypothetical protein